MSINDLNKFLAEELQEPLAIVCHDAGATNYILAWLHFYSKANQGKSINWRLVLQGPALRIWRDNPIVGVTLVPDVKIALNGARALLSGTGWATDLEMGARETASILGVPSIAVLDHWVNYKERFIRGQVLSLPQQIWGCRLGYCVSNIVVSYYARSSGISYSHTSITHCTFELR